MRATKILLGLALSFASVANARFHLQEVQVISQQTEIHSQAYRLVTEISREAIGALPYAFTNLDINLQQTNSRYLDYLRHKIVLQLEHGIYAGLRRSLRHRAQQRLRSLRDV